MKTIGVAFITHQAKQHLPHCLSPYLNSPLKPRVLVVNSSSNDGTVELAQELGAETLVIPRAEFNHGTTREAARKYLNTDIVVMVTPDAYASNADTLEELIRPIIENKASVTYARQIPHDGSDFFESFPRAFNYPSKSHIRGIADIDQYGVYTFFCSNSCAAYCNKALDSIGGFPSVLLGEDTIVVSNLLNRGHKIAYVAEAVVKHSHRYSLKQEFQRNFDTGLARSSYRHLFAGTKDLKRGKAFVVTMLKQLGKDNPSLIPYAFVQIMAKWSGYRLGQACVNVPTWIKRLFSSQDFYWSSNDYKKHS